VTRLGDTSPAPQPLAVGELDPGAVKRPSRQVACQRLLEVLACLCWVGDQRARMSENQRDPRTGPLTRHRSDLRHPCPRGIETVDMHCSLDEIRDQPG